jgi:hypothetical protein
MFFFFFARGDPKFFEWRRDRASFKGFLYEEFELFVSRAFQGAVLSHFEHFKKARESKGSNSSYRNPLKDALSLLHSKNLGSPRVPPKKLNTFTS